MKVLILGAGELASSIAHRLFRTGFTVAMTEMNEPLAIRRSVSFCSAVWDKEIVVEGVRARLCEASAFCGPPVERRDHIAVCVDPEGVLVKTWRPEVVIDARLLKRSGSTSVAQAPYVISLGPGAVCGTDAHVIVETHRGHNLGRLIEVGSASADTGVPGDIGGLTAERVVRAPVTGRVQCIRAIGDVVQAGELIARVGDEPVKTPIAGVLRGILHDGVLIEARTKLADVDPRGEVQACFTLSDKSRTISGAVLEAIMSRFPWSFHAAAV